MQYGLCRERSSEVKQIHQELPPAPRQRARIVPVTPEEFELVVEWGARIGCERPGKALSLRTSRAIKGVA